MINFSSPECKANSDSIHIPSTVTEHTSCEEVVVLNGLVIPAMYAEKYNGNGNHLFDHINKFYSSTNEKAFIGMMVNNITDSSNDISDNLYLGNVYSAVNIGYHHKLSQITKYNWLTYEMVNYCHRNMELHIGKDVYCEVPIEYKHELSDTPIIIKGFI